MYFKVFKLFFDLDILELLSIDIFRLLPLDILAILALDILAIIAMDILQTKSLKQCCGQVRLQDFDNSDPDLDPI